MKFVEVKINQLMFDEAEADIMASHNNSVLTASVACHVIKKVYPKTDILPFRGKGFYIKLNGKTWEVRAEMVKYEPRNSFQFAVFDKHKKTKRYFFVQVDVRFHRAWVIGRTSKVRFNKSAKWFNEGDKQKLKSTGRQHIHQRDAWCIPFEDIRPLPIRSRLKYERATQ